MVVDQAAVGKAADVGAGNGWNVVRGDRGDDAVDGAGALCLGVRRGGRLQSVRRLPPPAEQDRLSPYQLLNKTRLWGIQQGVARLFVPHEHVVGAVWDLADGLGQRRGDGAERGAALVGRPHGLVHAPGKDDEQGSLSDEQEVGLPGPLPALKSRRKSA